jgi:hypothetical protein
MPIVPSVAMNGSILPTVVMRPLRSPQAPPMTTVSAIAAVSMSAGSAMAPEFMKRIMIEATKATIEPTDRSRSPEEMTKVAPTATIAMKALRVATFARLVMPMKLGFTSAPTMSSSASAAKGATALRSTSRQLRPLPFVSTASSLAVMFVPDVNALF